MSTSSGGRCADYSTGFRATPPFCFKPFFVLDVPRALASSAAPDGRSSRTGRRSHDSRYRFPCGIHTTHYHNQSIACLASLSRDSRLHLLNSSLLRLRIARAWGHFTTPIPHRLIHRFAYLLVPLYCSSGTIEPDAGDFPFSHVQPAWFAFRW